MTVTIATPETRHEVAAHRTVDAATVTTVATSGFLIALAGLHVLKSDLSPTWRMVSEYEIGRHGWIMQAAFVMLAIGCLAASRVLRPITANRAGRVGRAALAVTAAGLTLAAFAIADPVTATKDQLTMHGNLHALGAMLGIPGFVVAAVAISRSLRHDPVYATSVRNATHVVLASVVVFIVSMIALFDGAPSTPDARIGIQNRILVVAHAAWLLVVAHQARRARR